MACTGTLCSCPLTLPHCTSAPAFFLTPQISSEQVEAADGESEVTGLSWHLHVRDRLPLDLVALVPLLLKHMNRGEVTH